MRLGVQQQRIMDMLAGAGWVTHYAITAGVARAYGKKAYRGLEPSIEGLVKKGLVKQIDLRVPCGYPFGHWTRNGPLGWGYRQTDPGPWEFANVEALSEAEAKSLAEAQEAHPIAQRFVLLARA